MSHANRIPEIQEKIKENLAQLEEMLENCKTYCSQCNLAQGYHLVHSFIEVQHNEIVHHLSQIRHHMQQINYHHKILEGINSNNNPTAESFQITVPLRFWEKIVEDQNLLKNSCIVKRRPKNVKECDKVPNIIVKNRVEQFEEMQKCKRTSSTIEPFLECNRSSQMSYIKCEENLCESFSNIPGTPRLQNGVELDLQGKPSESEEMQQSELHRKISTPRYQNPENRNWCESKEPDEESNEDSLDSKPPVGAKGDIVDNLSSQNENTPRIVEIHFKTSSSSLETEWSM